LISAIWCCSDTNTIFLFSFLYYKKRDEYSAQFGAGTGPLILARTDALQTDGFQAAIDRCLAFREAGCDMTFLEGAKLANMLEQGSTPILPPQELKQMGYTMAAYPLTLLSASIKAMTESLDRIQKGLPTDDLISTCKFLFLWYRKKEEVWS
jgi:2-methylisocitrate lyase-like PEP mutase family enzyme